MARDVEIKCSYCDTKEKFSEYKEAPYHGWTVFGWSMNTNTPYAKCPNCNKNEKVTEPEKKKRRKVKE